MREQIEALEHHAHFFTHFVDIGFAIQRRACYRDLAAGGFLQIVHAAQKRTLAGTGRANQCHHFLRLDMEVDTFEHFNLAKGFM